ncbi:sortase domain-containing protein [Thalassobacillus cyri]|uniref:sortase domain-containing protein n=1 Tax=Thalassobacillus cyri TaxID=571932 RepID=UPI000B84D0E4|nr:sortase [Thalassobacillus cyri]
MVLNLVRKRAYYLFYSIIIILVPPPITQISENSYKYFNIFKTKEDDRSVILAKDKPTLTLTTCYPFDFVGSAPDRYIVQAELVSVDKNG